MIADLVIFDLDGTLVDSRADLTAAINAMRQHYNLPELSLERVSGFIGNGMHSLVRRSLFDAPEVVFEEAVELNRSYYRDHLTVFTTCYPGVKEGIISLSEAGVKLAVLTNKPGLPSREILEFFGLADYFVRIIGGGDGCELKPEPEGLYACMSAAGSTDKKRVWMIGDHYTDLEVAANAGVFSGFAGYGFGDSHGRTPDRVFNVFSEVTEFFTRAK